jgi:hypothetical protein
LIIALPQQQYNNMSHTRQISSIVAPMPMEALMFSLEVGLAATPPYSYKPLGILAGPSPTIKIFCFSTKSWGEVVAHLSKRDAQNTMGTRWILD